MTAKQKLTAAVVLVTRNEDGSVTLCDANGKPRPCRSPEDYVRVLGQILDDPSLPQYEDVPPQKARVEEIVVEGVREAVPAFLRPFVRPGLHTMGSFLSQLSDARRSRRGRRRRKWTPPPISRSKKGQAA